MSLNVELILKGVQGEVREGVIFVRENGQTVELSREEWDHSYPNREPVTINLPSDDDCVFSANYTHNIVPMAAEAGIYKACWHPNTIDISKAAELIPILEAGVVLLRSDPEHFKKYNPKNGWGSYDTFVLWVQEYLDACRKYPKAEVRTST